ncbi:MAG: ABC transporter substrate-binding protein, partial [Clostridiales bacterium]|nr:ABC transporter substrate-binding protein [Clostridiales bacterium]
MKSARRILALLIVAVMLVASLGACTKTGGDKEGEGTAGDVSSTQPVEQPADDANAYKPFVEVQGVTDTEILVGNTAATTGAFATVGVPFNAGLEAALKEYGEFQGRTIRLVHYDDGFDGAQGLVYTKQLVEDDKVFALVGHFGTNTVGATLDYLVDKGVPMVYAATGIQELYQENAKGNDGVIYSVQPIYTTEGRVLLARAVAPKETGMGLGGKNIGVIATTDDSGAGLIAGVKNQAEKLGLDLKYQEVEPAATDYSAAVSVL